MPHDADEPITLTTARTEFEANVIAQSLRAEGVEARVVSVVGAVLGPYVPGMEDPIKVLVRAADLDRARAVLAQTRSDSVDIAWDELDVGESEDSLTARRPLGIRRWMGSSAIAALVFTLGSICIILLYAPLVIGLVVAIGFIALAALAAARSRSTRHEAKPRGPASTP